MDLYKFVEKTLVTTDVENALITTIVMLAIDIQRRRGALEKKYNIGRADGYMPSRAKKEYESLISEFEALKVRVKAIQNGG